MTRFILRFDDICASMDWSRFSRFEDLLARLPGVSPLLGVVPDNHDPGLKLQPDVPDFWDRVRVWRDRGWTIAQHGHTHVYTTRDGGLLAINRQSEFAGLRQEVQFEKLLAGKRILEREAVWQPYFMAPSHAFDHDTLRALRSLHFVAITDGWGIHPYELGGLKAVPQLFSTPKHFGIGVYTIALHTNQMSEGAISNMLRFVERNEARFISFPDAVKLPCANAASAVLQPVTRTLMIAARRIRAATRG